MFYTEGCGYHTDTMLRWHPRRMLINLYFFGMCDESALSFCRPVWSTGVLLDLFELWQLSYRNLKTPQYYNFFSPEFI